MKRCPDLKIILKYGLKLYYDRDIGMNLTASYRHLSQGIFCIYKGEQLKWLLSISVFHRTPNVAHQRSCN